MGSPDYAVQSLMALQMAGHDIVLVVTQPDRPARRGRKVTACAVKKVAEVGGLPVTSPEDVNAPGPVKHIAGMAPDVIVVVAYGQILSQELLAVPRMGAFNLHASLLPRYRGAAPLNWALINGETVTGVTVQAMLPKVDAGPIAGQQTVPILPEWTAGDLSDHLAKRGAALLVKVMNQLELGQLNLTDQARDQVTRAPRLTKADGIIDWSRSALEIHNRVRGVTPWPGAQTVLSGTSGGSRRVTLTRTEVVTDSGSAGKPGEIVAVGQAGVEIACGRGRLRLLAVKPAGKREMSIADFVHGHRLAVGQTLNPS